MAQVQSWSVEEVYNQLVAEDVPEGAARKLQEQEVDGSTLLDLTEEDLRGAGLDKLELPMVVKAISSIKSKFNVYTSNEPAGPSGSRMGGADVDVDQAPEQHVVEGEFNACAGTNAVLCPALMVPISGLFVYICGFPCIYPFVKSQKLSVSTRKLKYTAHCCCCSTDKEMMLENIQEIKHNIDCCQNMYGASTMTVAMAGVNKQKMMLGMTNSQDVMHSIFEHRDRIRTAHARMGMY